MVNDLINVNGLVFCKTCGRILYLAEEVHSTTRRKRRLTPLERHAGK